jgi:hypothetical protein
MERPIKHKSWVQLVLRSFLALLSFSEHPGLNESADEVGGFSTVDHADIRGSAFAAIMVAIRRELPRTGLAGWLPHNVIEVSPWLAGSTAVLAHDPLNAAFSMIFDGHQERLSRAQPSASLTSHPQFDAGGCAAARRHS